jgi:iron complex outermembrane receptor protein
VREGAYAQTEFFDLDAKWRPTDRLTLTAKAGTTKGKGVTPSQGVFEGDVNNSGASYQLNGMGSPATVKFPNIDVSKFTGTRWTGCSAYRRHRPTTKSYGQIDAAFSWTRSRCAKSIRRAPPTTPAPTSKWRKVLTGPTPTLAAPAPTRPGTAPPTLATSAATSVATSEKRLDARSRHPERVGQLHSNRDVSRTYYQDMFDLTGEHQGDLRPG